VASVAKNMAHQFIQKIKQIKNDWGGWFLFFILIYVICFIKLTANYHSAHYGTFFIVYSILIGGYILSRFLLAYFHKSMPFNPTYEPTVTFVVPAKNEGDNIYETLNKFWQVNYPLEKVEVIAINDGSTDKTYGEMLRAKATCEEKGIRRVEVVDWKVNRGKREGMAEGVKRAQNQIIIFIDSDSFIHPECVKHLVKYFNDPRIGAVSGHTDVYNRNVNMLTKMQSLRYYVAFTIYKAAESIFGSVTCCPGCCSAYRKSYLDPVIDTWLHQKFLGSQCTFGDDRSLTNFIIRQYDAVYSPEALAYTVVPETFRQYVKQQQRWKKSWIRETFIACFFMWKKNPIAAISFYSYMFLAFSAPVVFFRAIFYQPLFVTHDWPVMYLFGLAIMLILHGIYYRNHVKDSPWFLPAITFWFYTVMLMWQLPWAMITMRDSRWGTR
jgi:hyaluronan synthase